MSQLHTVGYRIHHGAVPVTEDLVQAMNKHAKHATTTSVIFNNKRRGGDKKRSQTPITASVKGMPMKKFYASLMMFATEKYPNLVPNTMTALTSEPGCKAQLPHCDYVPSYELALASDTLAPLGCLVAIEPDTKLRIWPSSIRLSYLADGQRDSYIQNVTKGPIKCEEVTLYPGDILVFRGDLVHAGSAYPNGNTRVHLYLDSPNVDRVANTTWFPNPSWIADVPVGQ